MGERRLTNSELRLQKLEAEEAERVQEKGILEIFERDEDAPLTRDGDEDDAGAQ
jgi:hypothetical protein